MFVPLIVFFFILYEKMSLSLLEKHLFDYMKMVSISPCDEIETVYGEITNSLGSTSKPLKTVISSINTVIKNYNFEIVESHDENISKDIYCLISTNNNTLVAQKANFYEKLTGELMSKIIKACVTSGNGSVSEIECLNMNLNTRSTKINIRSSLDRLIKEKWLISKDGEISLGMRCQLEFEFALKKQYPDYVKNCVLCFMFLLQGLHCSQCEGWAHNHCVNKYYQMNGLSQSCKKCPMCKECGYTTRNDESCSSVEMECDETALVTDPPNKRLRMSNE